jgi:hypothetical protein
MESTRAAARLLEMTTEIIEVEPISCDEILALKIFVAVTAPLCWSTDLLQSDSVTLFAIQTGALQPKSFVYFVSGAFSGGRDFHYVVV